MKSQEIRDKAFAVLQNCSNIHQLKTAIRYCELAMKSVEPKHRQEIDEMVTKVSQKLFTHQYYYAA